MLRVAVLLLLAASLLITAGTACGGDSEADVTSPVFGYLSAVTVGDDDSVEGVVLETEEGEEIAFAVQLESDAFVSGEHLLVHVEQRLPVRIAFAGKGDRRVAFRIDDAE